MFVRSTIYHVRFHSQVANEVIGEMNLKPDEVFLAQGTLRPDLIESASHLASGKADVIKTHHNDTELIRKLRDEVQRTCNNVLSSLFPSSGQQSLICSSAQE